MNDIKTYFHSVKINLYSIKYLWYQNIFFFNQNKFIFKKTVFIITFLHPIKIFLCYMNFSFNIFLVTISGPPFLFPKVRILLSVCKFKSSTMLWEAAKDTEYQNLLEQTLKLVSTIFIKFLFFYQMIALQKLWKMLFISSKKLFSFSRYSIFCISVLTSSTCWSLL